MNLKISFTVGVDAAGKLHPLYLGTDAEAAKAAYTAHVNGAEPELGLETVYLFVRPRQDRRHDVIPAGGAVDDVPFVVTPAAPVTETATTGQSATVSAEIPATAAEIPAPLPVAEAVPEPAPAPAEAEAPKAAKRKR